MIPYVSIYTWLSVGPRGIGHRFGYCLDDEEDSRHLAEEFAGEFNADEEQAFRKLYGNPWCTDNDVEIKKIAKLLSSVPVRKRRKRQSRIEHEKFLRVVAMTAAEARLFAVRELQVDPARIHLIEDAGPTDSDRYAAGTHEFHVYVSKKPIGGHLYRVKENPRS